MNPIIETTIRPLTTDDYISMTVCGIEDVELSDDVSERVRAAFEKAVEEKK